MFICDDLRTEVWRPDFSSSGQADPQSWTRVLFRGAEISNSLEWAEWSRNPVQVVLCDACGTEQCSSGGYVHVSRLQDFVLWSGVQPDDEEGITSDHVLRAIRTYGALAIPIARWDDWPVPRADQLVRSNHAAIADAWIFGAGRTTDTIVESLRNQCYGGDALSKKDAIALVDRTIRTFQAVAKKPFEQSLISPGAAVRFETLYFDGPAERDWTAFAFEGRETFVVLDRQHLVRIED